MLCYPPQHFGAWFIAIMERKNIILPTCPFRVLRENVWQGTFRFNTFRRHTEGKGFGFFTGLRPGGSIAKKGD
jgi:hypothetical protein